MTDQTKAYAIEEQLETLCKDQGFGRGQKMGESWESYLHATIE